MINKKLQYNNSIDYFKGILCILVFLGHLVVGQIENNLVRYFIYSFHMPLFIGISGYLFNLEDLKENPNIFIKKIFYKILVPYILASVFYCSFINLNFLIELNFREFIIKFFKDLICSYYHLWYIRGYISYMFITYFLFKLKLGKRKIFIITFFISVIIYYIYFFAKIDNKVLKIFLSNFQLYFLIFFITGSFIKDIKINIKLNKMILMLGIVTIFINSILEFYFQHIFNLNTYIVQKILIYYISNILFLIILLMICEKYTELKNNIINFIGKNSLYFYLWHVLPIMILKSKVLDKNIYLYYFLGIISFWLLYLIIEKYILIKNKKVVGKSYV